MRGTIKKDTFPLTPTLSHEGRGSKEPLADGLSCFVVNVVAGQRVGSLFHDAASIGASVAIGSACLDARYTTFDHIRTTRCMLSERIGTVIVRIVACLVGGIHKRRRTGSTDRRGVVVRSGKALRTVLCAAIFNIHRTCRVKNLRDTGSLHVIGANRQKRTAASHTLVVIGGIRFRYANMNECADQSADDAAKGRAAQQTGEPTCTGDPTEAGNDEQTGSREHSQNAADTCAPFRIFERMMDKGVCMTGIGGNIAIGTVVVVGKKTDVIVGNASRFELGSSSLRLSAIIKQSNDSFQESFSFMR